MKRYLFFLVVVLSVLSLLAGCAPKAEPAPEAAAPEADAKAPAAEEEAPAASDKVWRVAMIANTPIADGGWSSS